MTELKASKLFATKEGDDPGTIGRSSRVLKIHKFFAKSIQLSYTRAA